MSVSYSNVDINGVSKEAIIVDGVGDNQRVILRDQLSTYDEAQMDLISEASGASFYEKMQNTTLSNGITADVLYANFINLTVDLDALASRRGFDAYQGHLDQQAELDDHESRITTLEP